MAVHVDQGAQAFRSLDREEALERLRVALDKMLGIEEALTEEDWGGLLVPHKYMGPLPAFFYPVFQLVDYAVHSWDIREGSGQAARARRPLRRPARAALLRALDGDREGRSRHRADGARRAHHRPVRTPATRTSRSGPMG